MWKLGDPSTRRLGREEGTRPRRARGASCLVRIVLPPEPEEGNCPESQTGNAWTVRSSSGLGHTHQSGAKGGDDRIDVDAEAADLGSAGLGYLEGNGRVRLPDTVLGEVPEVVARQPRSSSSSRRRRTAAQTNARRPPSWPPKPRRLRADADAQRHHRPRNGLYLDLVEGRRCSPLERSAQRPSRVSPPASETSSFRLAVLSRRRRTTGDRPREDRSLCRAARTVRPVLPKARFDQWLMWPGVFPRARTFLPASRCEIRQPGSLGT